MLSCLQNCLNLILNYIKIVLFAFIFLHICKYLMDLNINENEKSSKSIENAVAK